MTIDYTDQVRTIATNHPMSTRVFHRYGIDFCCKGDLALTEACATLDLNPDEVREEIEKELESGPEAGVRWDHSEPAALIEHIVTTYHASLREELPRLDAMARKVYEVHGANREESLGAIVEVIKELRDELESHMAKEEEILFPMILEGRGAEVAGPVAQMEEEHRSAGTALFRLRELTENFEVPKGACHTWKALWHGLAALEQDLHDHIHLENNILFPQALGDREN